MFIPWYDPSVRLTGRWSNLDKSGAESVEAHNLTVATAPGAYFEAAFVGQQCVLRFQTEGMAQPMPHLWISVDQGAHIEVTVDRWIRVRAETVGIHVVKVIYKSSMELIPRWHAPELGAIAFLGFEAEAPAQLPPDHRPIIEFIGDSITEGVLIDESFSPILTESQLNRPYQDDNCATYAALTAEALNLRPVFQAYGAVGMTTTGQGGVPRAELIYPYVFGNTPYCGPEPSMILINHGANDRRHPADEYLQRYGAFLDMVTRIHPSAHVVCLSAFCGAFHDELRDFVEEYQSRHNGKVHFISSKGWVPEVPLHPLRDGHQIIAKKLTEELKKLFNL